MNKISKKMFRLNKKTAIILGVSLIAVTILSILLFTYMKSGKKHHIIENNRYYTIKVERPKLKQEKVQKDINKMIENSIKTIKNDAMKNKEQLKKEKLQYDLNIELDIQEFKGIKTVHLTKNYFSGGEHYNREDYTYQINEKDQTIKNLNDFFKPNTNYLELLSNTTYYKVLEYGEANQLILDISQVKLGTLPDIKNYEHFYFDEEGLHILIPPYQVGSWADGDIKITFPYYQIESLINFEKPNLVTENNTLPPRVEPRNLDVFKGKKVIAFTFDDGPAQNTTPRLLDELRKRQVKVTFFVLGNRVEAFPDILKQEYTDGHQIGSHTYNHLNLLKLSDFDAYKEIASTNDIIYKVIGTDTKYIRPPYGNTNEQIKKIENMTSILWSTDTQDWKYQNKDIVHKNIMNHVNDGSIVLLHDLYNSSIDGVLMAIDELKNQGYEFVTVDEMIRLKNITLDNTITYYRF